MLCHVRAKALPYLAFPVAAAAALLVVFALAATSGTVAAADDGQPPVPVGATPHGRTERGSHVGAEKSSALEAALLKASAIEDQLARVTDRVRQSSVTVLCRRDAEVANGETAAPGTKPRSALDHGGSGVLVNYGSRTWVLTNYHVATNSDAIDIVTCDGRVLEAELVDTLVEYDVALLRITSKAPGLKPVPIVARASRELRPGQLVLATGNPFFLAQDGAAVVTLGVISGLDRVLRGEHLYAGAIQHDAAVNPGNSGGPLWDTNGNLVGINGMIATRGGGGIGASSTGASFSIPIDQIEPHLRRLTDASKDAQAGTLGIETETSTDADGTPNGARIKSIAVASPVKSTKDTALNVSDVITAVVAGGKTQPIKTASDLLNVLTIYPADTPVRVRFMRGKRAFTWSGNLAPTR